ncbi:LysR family transcriptional regulator [Sinorhizobium meliloti]|uniref:LysR family transcriptional regulator n=1 Tax=Rhizobium meliloti TaxID=382 RepID=UPI002E154081
MLTQRCALLKDHNSHNQNDKTSLQFAINGCEIFVMSFDGRLLTGVSVFLAVAEAGNFAKAADVLGVTPSGISRAIGRLETRMGVRLFDRTPRSVALTEEGRLFRLQALPLVAGLEEAAATAAGSAAAVAGRLRVSIDPWFARTVLAPQLPRLTETYPDLKIDLMTANSRDDMMSGVDVAVRFGSTNAGSLIARKLLDIRVITCAAPSYLERFGVPTRPEDIDGHEAILFRDPETGRAFPWEFHRGGEIIRAKVEGRIVFDDPSAAVAACIAGQGIFQSLEIGLDSWLQTGQLRQILKNWSDEHYPLYAYHPARHLPPAKVRAFLDFVQRVAREKARH